MKIKAIFAAIAVSAFVLSGCSVLTETPVTYHYAHDHNMKGTNDHAGYHGAFNATGSYPGGTSIGGVTSGSTSSSK